MMDDWQTLLLCIEEGTMSMSRFGGWTKRSQIKALIPIGIQTVLDGPSPSGLPRIHCNVSEWVRRVKDPSFEQAIRGNNYGREM